MLKLVSFFVFCLIIVQATDTKTIEKKILRTKKILKTKLKLKNTTNDKIKNLANAIKAEENIYNDLQYNLNKVSNNILLNKLKLQRAKATILQLEKQTQNLKKSTLNIEEKIVNNIVINYSLTLGKSLINKNSINGIIQKEKYDLILDNTKNKILESNLQYFKLSNDKRKNTVKKQKIENFIEEQLKKKKKFKILQEKQAISLQKLKLKHKQYQAKLKAIIKKQDSINSLLNKLNIVKNETIKKERLAKLKAKRLREKRAKQKAEQEAALKKLRLKSKKIKLKTKTPIKSKEILFNSKKKFEDDIDLKVRNIGSTSKGIKISSYYGAKTISPLKNYLIVKKFGKYYDPVYKIKLFNESISLKSKIPNAKVYCILKGKVVYAQHNAGELGNVVIVKHKNNIHTIYSQLSNIPSSLKVGQWIKKGYVVGRVKTVLVFQVTKNNKYVDPTKLIR